MRHRKRVWFIVIAVLTACARPSSGSFGSARLPSGSITLSGTISGLAPETSADLRLEQLAANQKVGQGQVVARFGVRNGQWEQAGLGLEPGRYGLVAEAEGYVSRFGTTTFEIMSGGGVWSYRHLDFELLRAEDAVARVGVPLCSTPPPQGGEYAVPVPEGPPTATPTLAPRDTTVTASAPAWPPGTCYAGQYAWMQHWSAGASGEVSGLPAGQVASILFYSVPPVPGENYSIAAPPPLDGSWHYPDGLVELATAPIVGPEEVLTPTLTVSNGQWGVIDNDLAAQKYVVMAQASGQEANPPAYEVVVFGGKILVPTSGVDFNFGSK